MEILKQIIENFSHSKVLHQVKYFLNTIRPVISELTCLISEFEPGLNLSIQ